MKFIVKEVVTLVFEIEADSEAEALAKHRDMSARDFDEVDCSVPEKITIAVGED